MEIPIKNIYYLLCYAWDKLEELDLVDVESIASNKMVDLFASVLIGATTRLLKQGLDRYYIEHEEEVNGMKGKINFSLTIKSNSLPNLKTVCEYDEFSYNILHNRLLKTTISKLIRTEEIDDRLKYQLHVLERSIPSIEHIQIRLRDFKQVRLHRNNLHYDFVLKICQLIFELQLIDESKGTYKFKDFLRDKRKMAVLFESFVRNYYRIRHHEFTTIKPAHIKWKFVAVDDSDESVIPTMKTDITLLSTEKKIIIDTKFYPKALVASREGSKEKFISHHLYQITSYLINQEEPDHEITITCAGILLYPTVNLTFDYKYKFRDHLIRLMTIDLASEWRNIESSLDELVIASC